MRERRLELMFVSAHPAIAQNVRTPLMLQTVMGLEAKEIASAYLMPAQTLAQRLVRAKRKIKEARIPFAVPEKKALMERLRSVLEAVYAAFSLDWMGEKSNLSEEALYLSSLLRKLLPDEPEVMGLHALLLFCAARERARVHEGVFVPLDEQDRSLYEAALIDMARKTLHEASTKKSPGRFQLEAAIQGAHHEQAPPALIATLYRGLLELAPSYGAHVAYALAVSKVAGAERGLALLSEVPNALRPRFQAYWTARAELEKQANLSFRASLDRAISLTTDTRLRRYLESK